MSKEVGERIRSARKKAGLTQAGLALRLGMVRSAVTNYERGVNDPGTDTLGRIAQICDVSSDELLGRPAVPRWGAGGLNTPRDEHGGLRVEAMSTTTEDAGIRPGDWEGLARTLAAAFAQHEESERIRAQAELAAREAERFAREADLIAHRTVEATVNRLLSGVTSVTATANGEGPRTFAESVTAEHQEERLIPRGGLPRPG